jgi:hypothetical protein
MGRRHSSAVTREEVAAAPIRPRPRSNSAPSIIGMGRRSLVDIVAEINVSFDELGDEDELDEFSSHIEERPISLQNQIIDEFGVALIKAALLNRPVHFACILSGLPADVVQGNEFILSIPVMIASEKGYPDIIKSILSRDNYFDISVEMTLVQCGFVFAATEGHADVLRVLLQSFDFRMNMQCVTDALHYATEYKHMEAITLIITDLMAKPIDE